MPEFTDRERIVRLEEWRLGVDKKLDEILDEVRKNNGKDIPLKWMVAIAAGVLAVLGGSVASVADLLGSNVP